MDGVHWSVNGLVVILIDKVGNCYTLAIRALWAILDFKCSIGFILGSITDNFIYIYIFFFYTIRSNISNFVGNVFAFR